MKIFYLVIFTLFLAFTAFAQTKLYTKSSFYKTGFDVTDSVIYFYNNANQAFTTMDDIFKYLYPIQLGTKPAKNNYAGYLNYSDTIQNGIGCPLYDSTKSLFDGNNNVLSTISYKIINNSKNSSQFLYDANGNLVQQYDSNSYWGDYYRYDIVRQSTSPFSVIEKNTSLYDATTMQWKLIQTDSFTYNSLYKITSFTQYGVGPGYLKLDDRFNYYYDNNNNLDSIAREVNTGSFNKYQTWVFTKNASGQAILIKDMRWNVANNAYWDFEIDSLGYATTTSKYPSNKIKYSFVNNVWQKYSRDTYTFNVNNFVAKWINEIYTSANTWEVDWINNYYYTPQYPASTKNFIKNEDVVIYPNPANNFISISNKNFGENVQLFIYNIDGKLLMQQNLSTQNINISKLPNGLYFLRIHAEGKIYNTKFSKL
jgi:Secretion system C-terminal sorting domain